ncbi:alpha/beta hydrolase [Aquimarina sp. U1-2]|uniref:alpha/beta hydrolase n=1 Tax=Aquimarina sp. U1-2 TaxID=2823141 RepID=UPI001AECEE04|nr:alpha/beta hydrolase [Aquimarina sp. U1-2]MBP2832887.1 alpha/beta hydrolase [Aquimarina sp. U1-2]
MLFLVHVIHGQDKDFIDIWPTSVPGEQEPKRKAKIDKKAKDTTTIHLTDVTNPGFTVFKPKASKRNGIGILIAPGGGYHVLAIDKEGYEIAQWLTTLGYTAFVLQYRVPKKEEGALQDMQRAIRVVRNYAEDYEIKSDSIGVLGFSAGGSLCARLGSQYNQDTYPSFDTIDTIQSKPNFSILIYPAYLDKGKNRSLTPGLNPKNHTLPTFIFATADDYYANSALVWAQSLRDQEIPVELHLLPEGGHGYGLREGNKAAETWPQLLQNWLEHHIH